MQKYLSVKETAEKWGVSQTLVRRYCTQDRIPRAKCQNGIWLIPDKAKKPDRASANPKEVHLPPLAKKLVVQKKKKNYHGLYDYVQIDLTYSSSRMASNRLTRAQVESIFRKGKVRESFEPMKVSDCVEIMNHCFCVDYILDNICEPLSHNLIQRLHYLLMLGTIDHRKQAVNPGVYRTDDTKRSIRTMTPCTRINSTMSVLINHYEGLREVGLAEILNFHVELETIVPFDDGNGRLGRLIMFKECLRHDIMPFIIDDKRRGKYIAGIQAWQADRMKLMQVAFEAQERFEKQVARHKLAEYRLPEYMNILDEDYDELEDED